MRDRLAHIRVGFAGFDIAASFYWGPLTEDMIPEQTGFIISGPESDSPFKRVFSYVTNRLEFTLSQTRSAEEWQDWINSRFDEELDEALEEDEGGGTEEDYEDDGEEETGEQEPTPS